MHLQVSWESADLGQAWLDSSAGPANSGQGHISHCGAQAEGPVALQGKLFS